jgi:hypothetical protein
MKEPHAANTGTLAAHRVNADTVMQNTVRLAVVPGNESNGKPAPCQRPGNLQLLDLRAADVG